MKNMRRLPAFACLALVLLAAVPASASIGIDPAVAVSSEFVIRAVSGDQVEDYVHQAYGLALHGQFIGEESGWQIELEYIWANQDPSGRALEIVQEKLLAKYPQNKEVGSGGSSIYYWVLRLDQDEVNTDGALKFRQWTGLLGLEAYSYIPEGGSFGLGGGVGWRRMAAGYEASGLAAAWWLYFTAPLGGHAELFFSTGTTWAKPRGQTLTLLQKETLTGLGLGIKF